VFADRNPWAPDDPRSGRGKGVSESVSRGDEVVLQQAPAQIRSRAQSRQAGAFADDGKGPPSAAGRHSAFIGPGSASSPPSWSGA